MEQKLTYTCLLLLAGGLGACSSIPPSAELPPTPAELAKRVAHHANGEVITTTSPNGTRFVGYLDHNTLYVIGGADNPEGAIACIDGPSPDGNPEWCRQGVVTQTSVPGQSSFFFYLDILAALASAEH
jgi:hypothetical protein